VDETLTARGLDRRIHGMKMYRRVTFALCTVLVCFTPCAHATYSIVACDAHTRECGVAVQTNNLAVGASVPYAQAGVGAVASQYETNPNYGPRGLFLIAGGKSPQDALNELLREDDHFDGEGVEARQVGIVAVDGRAVSYTGREAASSAWAGGHSGTGYSIQGNGLLGPQVVEAMERAFLASSGPLADRLLVALIAGDSAGGQKTGRESAALLVRTPEGFPLDIDLRVDHASDPIVELQQLYNMQSARQRVIEAEVAARKGQFGQARSLLIGAVARAPQWARLWIRAAKIAEGIEEPELALQYINVAFSENRAWAQQEIGSGDYAELGADPVFHRWITADQEQHVISAYQHFRAAKATTPQDRVRMGRMLLEVGHPGEALIVLKKSADTKNEESIDFQLLRAEGYAADGNLTRALEECRDAARRAPQDLRVRLKIKQLTLRAEISTSAH
jgi:uncharacterized Ntn-hydrolase superfamily protein